jgi:hypothetical protein
LFANFNKILLIVIDQIACYLLVHALNCNID